MSWRILIWLFVVAAVFLLPIRKGYEYTLFPDYLRASFVKDFPQNVFIEPLANFDGIHYITIANHGYNINAGFFPLFPIVLFIVSSVLQSIIHFPQDILLLYTSFLINCIFFFAVLVFLYKLLLIDYHKKTALETVFFLLVFPTSFFFAAAYSESLFFLLVVLVFYFCRREKFIIAAILGILLTATRPVGIAIIPAVVYELFLQKNVSIKQLISNYTNYGWFWGKAILLSLVMSLGIVAYSIFNYFKWQNPFFFIHAQGAFKNGRSVTHFISPFQTIIRYIKILLTVSPSIYEWRIALLEFSVFFLTITLLFIAWKKKVRVSYIIFCVLAFLIPICTGTFSGLPRYVLPFFPMFVALALTRGKVWKILYVIVSIVLLGILCGLFSRGYFIA